jgi:osmoprotectant transport system permease protein
MSRYLSIDRVSLAVSAGGLASVILTGFVIFRPNRLLGGEPILLWDSTGKGAGAIFLAWAILTLLSVFRTPYRIRDLIPGPLTALLIPLYLQVAGSQAEAVYSSAGPVARVSLGPGFWISIFSLAVLISEAWRRSRLSRGLTAAAALISAGLILLLSLKGRLNHLSLAMELLTRPERFLAELRTHLLLAATAVSLAVIIGVPLGILAHRWRRWRGPVFFSLNSLQTIPSLALFGILIPVLAALTARFPLLKEAGIQAIGTAPALIALTVYSLLPVTRNTHAGFNAVDPWVVEAGRGMGMTGGQLLLKVELPIASPIILSGVRVALVQAVGLTAVAALIGAGGLGVFIFQGLGQAAMDLILLGAIPTICIAVAADSLSGFLSALVKPEGLE